ncbi:MAG: DUF2889 domain-containing protein [Candidatus Helarchaeota archaeon]
MLKFCRNKFVGYEKIDETKFSVQGVLEDNLYAHEVEIIIDILEFEIISIKGKMKRYTTPLCPQATDKLELALGLKIEPGFSSKIRKIIGRPGCRHYANIINECCDSLIPALIALNWRDAIEQTPNISKDIFLKDLVKKYPQIKNYCKEFSGYDY